MHSSFPTILPSACIPGTHLQRPTDNIVFNRLMGHNRGALESLLTAVLQPKSPIETIAFIPIDVQWPHVPGKQYAIDLMLKLQDGSLIDLELHSSREANCENFSLCGTSEIVSRLCKSESSENQPCLAGIYIFDDVVFPSTTEVHSCFQLRRSIPADGLHMQPNLLRIDFIELSKISNLKLKDNPLLATWVQFFAARSAEAIETAANSNPEIDQLVEELYELSEDENFIDLLNKGEIKKIIAQGSNSEAFKDARTEGTRQALLNSIHTVLSRKMSVTRDALVNRMSHRSIAELEALLAAALDFTSSADLDAWEKAHQRSSF